MPLGTLEHANITVSDPNKTAQMLTKLFGWHVRWEGDAMSGEGYTIHVGTHGGYLALYAPKTQAAPKADSYHLTGGLNHVGIVVPDLDKAEKDVKALGLTTHSHQDYEPGKRFYFHDPDGVEFEVISYA